MTKGKKPNTPESASMEANVTPLVDVARSIGTSLGTAAAATESVAREIGTLAESVSKQTVATSRKIFRRAQKSLRTQAARFKARPKKKTTTKRKPSKAAKRGKK